MPSQRAKPRSGARLNPSDPLAKDLAAAWTLNEGAGAFTLDGTRQGQNGTLTNGKTWVHGPWGPTPNVPVDCGVLETVAYNEVQTVCSTCIHLNNSQNWYYFSYGDSSGGWSLVYLSGYGICTFISGIGYGVSNYTPAANVPFNLSAVINSTSIVAYVNGTAIHTMPYTITSTSHARFGILGMWDNSNWTGGFNSGSAYVIVEGVKVYPGAQLQTIAADVSSPDPFRMFRPRRVLYGYSGGGGGTTYDETYTASSTPAGALTRQVLRAYTGSTSPAGALNRLTQRKLAASTTAVGALAKLSAKPLSASATPAGTLARQTDKSLAGNATPAGTLAKQTDKTLTGSTTPAGSLSTLKVVARAFTASVTVAGSLVRQCARSLAGSVTGSGALVRSAAKSLAGSATPAGVYSALRVVVRAFSGSVTATGSLVRSCGKGLGGAVAGAGSVAKKAARTLTGSSQPAGTVAKQANKVLAGSVTPAGSVTVLRLLLRTFAGSVGAAGGLVRSSLKSLKGLVTGTGGLTTNGGAPTTTPGGRRWSTGGRGSGTHNVSGRNAGSAQVPGDPGDDS